MKVFCERCGWLPEAKPENGLYEASGTEIVDGVECYVCPEGHPRPKAVVDLMSAEESVALCGYGNALVDMVTSVI